MGPIVPGVGETTAALDPAEFVSKKKQTVSLER